MSTQFKRIGTLIIGVAALALAAGTARGQGATNWWTGASSQDFNTAGNWSLSHVPATGEFVAFTNVNSSTPVTFSANARDYGLLMYNNSSITFNLSGKNWTNYQSTFDGVLPAAWITNTTPGTIRISSQSSTGYLAIAGSAGGTTPSVISFNPSTTLIIDDSLGAPAVVSVPMGYQYYVGSKAGFRANVVVGGPGSQFIVNTYAGNPLFQGSVTVTNQASFIIDDFPYGGSRGDNGMQAAAVTTTVINASMKTGATGPSVVGNGYEYPATVILSNNAKWTDSGSLTVGLGWDGVVKYQGQLLMDQSTYYGQQLTLGGFAAVHNGAGFVQVANNSTMVLSNGYLLVSNLNYLKATNTFILNNSTLYLGKTGVNGVITNRGILTAQGTITGRGAGNFLLRNEGSLTIGGSPGVLTLNKGNVELAANSLNNFQFSDTALSQIYAPNGYVNLLGTNRFSLAAGSAPFVSGVKWGLGVYDFAIGTSINTNWQYDNLVNLLTNTYGLTYGVDFQYGVVNLGGGLFALELAFVPEPSTVVLLALGALLMWRRIVKGRRKAGQAVGAIIACGLILTMTGGSARGQSSTNYWTGGVSSDFNTAGNWSAGVPTSSQFVAFTNVNSATPVTFSAKALDFGLLMFNNPSITFNLSGQTWSNYCNPWSNALPALWLTNNTPGVMRVSSQGSTGYLVMTGSLPGYQPSVVGLSPISTLMIDDSLGAPAVVTASMGYQYYAGSQAGLRANVVVGGPGSQFIVNTYPGNARFMGSVVLSNQASFMIDDFLYGGPRGDSPGIPAFAVTATVINASMKTGATGPSVLGPSAQYPGLVILSNNSTWTDSGTLQVGRGWDGTVDYQGKLTMDQSTYNGQSLAIGDFAAVHNGPGYVRVANNSTMVLSNGYLLVSNLNYLKATNTFILNNSTLYLGKTGVNGAITNRGILTAQGTITGRGAGNFLLRNEGSLTIGGSPGVLTLNKGNVELAANSLNNFQFSDTALSQIYAPNGYVNLLGTNRFSLVAGSAPFVSGVKWGLGVYDFAIGTSINTNWQYDNLVNLLTNTYGLTYGVDFQYGVVNLGGGLFALELAFVPEPSTVVLLVLGGLMVWRRIAKRGKTAASSR